MLVVVGSEVAGGLVCGCEVVVRLMVGIGESVVVMWSRGGVGGGDCVIALNSSYNKLNLVGLKPGGSSSPIYSGNETSIIIDVSLLLVPWRWQSSVVCEVIL